MGDAAGYILVEKAGVLAPDVSRVRKTLDALLLELADNNRNVVVVLILING
jgi:hypothetical protein